MDKYKKKNASWAYGVQEKVKEVKKKREEKKFPILWPQIRNWETSQQLKQRQTKGYEINSH